MKHLAKMIRAVAIAVFIVAAQLIGQQVEINGQRNFEFMQYALYLPSAAVLFGALLRSDVFFQLGRVFHVDWLSLLLIGLPGLIVAYSVPILFYAFPNLELPQFFSVLFGDLVRLMAGVVCGYTLVNGFFAIKGVGDAPFIPQIRQE